MNERKPTVNRNQRLQSLLMEQSRVRRSRVRRRNATIASAVLLLAVAGVWWASPGQPAQPQRSQQAVNPPLAPQVDPPQSENGQPSQPESGSFRIVKVEPAARRLTVIVSSAEPQRVEFISDLQLLIAMRGQGIDAGLMRIDGTARLAFNDEESRRRFERGFDSAE